MAVGHAAKHIINAHYARRPQYPERYLKDAGPVDPAIAEVQELRFKWWVAWLEHLLNLETAPDAAQTCNGNKEQDR